MLFVLYALSEFSPIRRAKLNFDDENAENPAVSAGQSATSDNQITININHHQANAPALSARIKLNPRHASASTCVWQTSLRTSTRITPPSQIPPTEGHRHPFSRKLPLFQARGRGFKQTCKGRSSPVQFPYSTTRFFVANNTPKLEHGQLIVGGGAPRAGTYTTMSWGLLGQGRTRRWRGGSSGPRRCRGVGTLYVPVPGSEKACLSRTKILNTAHHARPTSVVSLTIE